MLSPHEQLEKSIELIRQWPAERQEDAVQTLLAMQKVGTATYRLSHEERAAVEEGLTQALQGELVDDKAIYSLDTR